MLSSPSEHLVGVDVMTTGDHRHRGALRTRLLNDAQLLFDRVPHPRPSPPAQRISRYDLFSENAHRTPTWTPTMCPLSPSWVLRAPPAMRPKPDGYKSSALLEKAFIGECRWWGVTVAIFLVITQLECARVGSIRVHLAPQRRTH